MGKNNKARRAMKQRRRAKRIKEKNKRDNNNRNENVYNVLQSPFAQLSDKEREQFLDETGEINKTSFHESLIKLKIY